MADVGRPLGPCNLLTLAEAIRELGVRHADGRAWLIEHGLVRLVAGRRRVIAGELIEAIQASPLEGDGKAAAAKARGSLPSGGLLDQPMARL